MHDDEYLDDGEYVEESEESDPEAALPLTPWAVVSLALGLIAFSLLATAGPAIGVFAAIAGHAARHEINTGLKSGWNYATWGLRLGYACFVLGILIHVF